MIAQLGGWSDVLLHQHVMRRRVESPDPQSAIVEIDGERLMLRAVSSPAGRAWLSIAVVVMPEAALHLRGALAANLELPIGALAVWRDQVVLRQTLALRELPVSVLEQALASIAETARAVRQGTAFGYVAT